MSRTPCRVHSVACSTTHRRQRASLLVSAAVQVALTHRCRSAVRVAVQGTLSVDTFFFISGFLASYMLLIKLDKVSLGSPPPFLHTWLSAIRVSETDICPGACSSYHPFTDPVPMTSLATCLRRRPRA